MFIQNSSLLFSSKSQKNANVLPVSENPSPTLSNQGQNEHSPPNLTRTKAGELKRANENQPPQNLNRRASVFPGILTLPSLDNLPPLRRSIVPLPHPEQELMGTAATIGSILCRAEIRRDATFLAYQLAMLTPGSYLKLKNWQDITCKFLTDHFPGLASANVPKDRILFITSQVIRDLKRKSSENTRTYQERFSSLMREQQDELKRLRKEAGLKWINTDAEKQKWVDRQVEQALQENRLWTRPDFSFNF
jgi:hypothetical protein